MTREEKISQMRKMLGVAETADELKQLAFLFILDMSYERSDITRVIHDIEVERGWHT
jgi:hypothetical protein